MRATAWVLLGLASLRERAASVRLLLESDLNRNIDNAAREMTKIIKAQMCHEYRDTMPGR